MKQTAGTLLYRFKKKVLEVLLVHPSGNYNKKSPWSIPKGLPDDGEELEEAARRETIEETGVTPGDLVPLGYVEYTKSRKRVHCYAGPSPEDAQPTCASWEVDRAEFVAIDEAKRVLHPDQCLLLWRLEDLLDNQAANKP
jgi:predicted NUDIX family NTP pyrophosphohydrolase